MPFCAFYHPSEKSTPKPPEHFQRPLVPLWYSSQTPQISPVSPSSNSTDDFLIQNHKPPKHLTEIPAFCVSLGSKMVLHNPHPVFLQQLCGGSHHPENKSCILCNATSTSEENLDDIRSHCLPVILDI